MRKWSDSCAKSVRRPAARWPATGIRSRRKIPHAKTRRREEAKDLRRASSKDEGGRMKDESNSAFILHPSSFRFSSDLCVSVVKGLVVSTRRLIVTADDVGLHRGMTEGAIRAHRDGIVTACSVVASGVAFDDAVAPLR